MRTTLVLMSAAIVMGTTFQPLGAAEFKHSGCGKAADMQFPNDRLARKDFKHWCKDQWKIYKEFHKANNDHG